MSKSGNSDEKPMVRGEMGLPQPTPGTLGHFTAEVRMENGARRLVTYDQRSGATQVLDGNGGRMAAVEMAPGGWQVVLADGTRPPVSGQVGRWKRTVRIGDEEFRSVMMLEGRKRVFGNDRLRLIHRDYHNEVRIIAEPELEAAAILVAFEVYGRTNCHDPQIG